MEFLKSTQAQICEYLSSFKIFFSLSVEQIEMLSRHCKLIRIAAGDILITKGDAPDNMYFVIEGKLQVYQQEKKKFKEISILGMGDVIGEIGVLTHEPRSASVKSLSPCILLSISNASVDELIEKNPQIIMNISLESLKRLRKPLGIGDILSLKKRPFSSYVLEYISSFFAILGTIASIYPHWSMFFFFVIADTSAILMTIYFRTWVYMSTQIFFLLLNFFALYRIYLGLWGTK